MKARLLVAGTFALVGWALVGLPLLLATLGQNRAGLTQESRDAPTSHSEASQP